jgi:hypothetical protein
VAIRAYADGTDMTPRKTPLDPKRQAQVRAELHRDLELRQKGYRERALKLFQHICGRCGRDFSGKRLRELTVHHKDHNHDNNPSDGSNWELLCVYCHDDEHAVDSLRAMGDGPTPHGGHGPSPIVSPFERLGDLMDTKAGDDLG